MKIKAAFLSALFAATLAMPIAAEAQGRHDGPRHGYSQQGPRHVAPRHVTPPRHVAPPRHVQRHHWKRGQHVTNWRRQPVVRDYKRRGLRAPARGQQWVQVDNTYLLVNLANGLILSLATR